MSTTAKEAHQETAPTIQSRVARRPQTEQERRANADLGRRIANLRKESGLTQVELAQTLGVIQSVISSYETGRVRPSPEMIKKLSEAIGVSADELLGRKTKDKTSKRGPISKLERQVEQIKKLPRAKQRFVIEMIDAVITQAQRSTSS